MKIKHYLLIILLASLAACEQPGRKLTITQKVDVIATLAREPMLAEHPSGALFVTGYRNASKEPQLWKSADQGATWEIVNVGTLVEGAHGNSDADLVIDEEGTIYFLTMKYTQIPEDTTNFDYSSMKGEHIAIGVSQDAGDSWTWSYLSRNDFDDRPWVVIGQDGTAHVIWNDGNGVHYTKSADKGATWERQPSIAEKGGSSHFAVGPEGQLAARIVPISASGRKFDEGVDLIRLSLDNGATWKDVAAPGNRTWSRTFGTGVPRWVEPIAWDSNNRLHYLWSEGTTLHLARSEDNGQSWDSWMIKEGTDTLYYPFLAIENDQITCSWISGFATDLRHNVAVIDLATGAPTLIELEPLELSDTRTRYGINQELSTGGEYFPIRTLSDGTIGMVTTLQNYEEEKLGFTWWRLKVE